MPVRREAFVLEAGKLTQWHRTAESGRVVTAGFCADCGSRLFHEPARNPAIINVKPGSLDDTSWLEPVGHLWLKSAQPWFKAPEGALAYPEQPADFEALFRRFEERFTARS